MHRRRALLRALVGPALVAVIGAPAPAALGASGDVVEPTVVTLTPAPVVDGMGWVPTGLGDLGGDTWLERVGPDGTAVGAARSPSSDPVAVRWSWPDPAPVVLPGDLGSSLALDVDAFGNIVGFTTDPATPGALLWPAGGGVVLLEGSVGARGIATGVHGDVIAGYEIGPGGPGLPGVMRPVAWTGPMGSRSELDLPADDEGAAYDVGPTGSIVGFRSPGENRAIGWSGVGAPVMPAGPPSATAVRSVAGDGSLVGDAAAGDAFVSGPDGDPAVILDIPGRTALGMAGAVGALVVVQTRVNSDPTSQGVVWSADRSRAHQLIGRESAPVGIGPSGRIFGSLRNVPGGVQRAVRWELRDVAFADVPGSSPFVDEVTQLVLLGSVTGYVDGGFHPMALVSRQALAALVYRTVGWLRGNDPPCDAAPFDDVVVGSAFCGHITWAADEGVTGGFADGGFHPAAPVSRQALVVQLYRVLGSPDGADPGCATAPFPDVPASHPFCGEIAWAADEGITSGYADGGFHPTAPVTRQAAAAQLSRVHDLLIAAG